MALKRGGTAVIDEGKATRVAQALGVRSVSTLFVPIIGFRKATLDRKGAEELLKTLAVVTGAKAETLIELSGHLGGTTNED